jgi:hypothetical protein
LVETALTDKVPWRFRSEPASDEDRDRPHPLQGERETVGKRAIDCEDGAKAASDQKLSHHPTCVNIAGFMKKQRIRTLEIDCEVEKMTYAVRYCRRPTGQTSAA